MWEKKCYFVVWMPDNNSLATADTMHTEIIEYDEAFCRDMISKLEHFYQKFYLPVLLHFIDTAEDIS